jgi:hypothetical protein
MQEKVKALLSHYGIVKLSRLLFCSYTIIYYWIEGKRNPSVFTGKEIAKLYNKLNKEKRCSITNC